MTRVLTDEPGVWEDNGIYYRIGYPKALLEMSNGRIFKLEARKAIELAYPVPQPDDGV
jgi:hypothetical protein